MNLPLELDFIRESLEPPSNLYQRAEWLLSPFPDHSWRYNFGFKKGYQELFWDVPLSDGSALIDSKNRDLLNGLKYWLIASTTPHGRGVSNDLKVQYAGFNRTLHLIDYLILNDRHFKLCRYGLAGLSGDDLIAILERISSAPTVAESLFNWPQKLIGFCRNLLEKTDPKEINFALDQNEAMSDVDAISEDESRGMGLDPRDLPSLRAALHVNGYMVRNNRLGFAPNSAQISKLLYPNTVRVKSIDKPAFACLSYWPESDSYVREFTPVDVTTGSGDSISKSAFTPYVAALYRMGVLHEINLGAPPIDGLLALTTFNPELKTGGRFRTLPSSLVFDSVRKAVEFHFDLGRDILDAYLRLAIIAKRKGCSLADISGEEFTNAIGSKLSSLGVKELDSKRRIIKQARLVRGPRESKAEYFKFVRANRRLLPLIRIYFGATQLVVGALTARRVGELQDLEIDGYLDNSGTWIVFSNRKSSKSSMGLRATEARPIEPVGAKMLREIERFQKILNRIGASEKVTSLFSPPCAFGTNKRIAVSPFSYNRHLDEFCDYFETDLNSEGKRHYIRQHQLRRFFALLFFYSSSFGSLETLQWMLGHTDLRHVWHYITESMSGEVLRGAKSQYIAEKLHYEGGESFKDLAALLEKRYGTKDFTLLDTEELEDYVSELLEEGEIEVEPEFFEDSEGEKFKVLVSIKELGGDKS